MKTIRILPLALALVLARSAAPDDTKPARPATATRASKPVSSPNSVLERGKYLTILGGCNDCQESHPTGSAL